jgi:uncharacterized membrane protein
LAVVLQLVPFLYIFAALTKIGTQKEQKSSRFGATTLRIAGVVGFFSTAVAMGVAFVPSRHIDSIWLFEAKMVTGTLFFLGLAAFLFYSAQRKAARVATSG